MLIECSCKVVNDLERRSLMAWVRATANAGYSELGDMVHMSYEAPEGDERMKNIIKVFENYPVHSIRTSEKKR